MRSEPLALDMQQELTLALEQANTALKQQQPELAKTIYQHLVEQNVADPRPYCNLGALALMEECSEAAIGWLKQALHHDANHARSHLNLGMALHLQAREEEAVHSLRRAIELDPDLVEAWNNLGVALMALDRPEEAIEAYRGALQRQQDNSRAAVNLSVLLANHGHAVAGENLLRDLPAAAVNGSVLFHLGEMLRLQGRGEEAMAAYEECMAREPGDWDLRFGVGLALIACGEPDEALAVLLPLLAMRPDDANPLVAVGWSLFKIGEVQQAVELLGRALQLDPSLVRAYNLLGLCFSLQGKQEEAVEQYRAGLALEPKDVELRCNLAGSLRNQGDLDRSMAEMDTLLEEEPDCLAALIIQMFSCSISSEELAPLNLDLGRRYWQLQRRSSSSLALGASTQPASAPIVPAQELEQAPVLLPAETAVEQVSEEEAPAHDGRLRVGFLSAEIGDHVVGSFLAPFLRFHNRDRFAVELFVASRRFDPTATRLAAQAERHWLLYGMDVGRARELIRRRRLDVLVETSGFTSDSGIDLLSERCAPIQCHYIGYHASTGLDTMDFFIGDGETVPEEFAPQFVERLWRLPRPWLAREPERDLPPALSVNQEPIPVLGSFNQMAKVRGETLRFWAAALQAVPLARLLLKDRSTTDATIRNRILSTLAEEGIDPKRVEFLPHQGTWQDHMNCYNRLDIALDTTPWSSATTGFDALSMGVPLVAIRGRCTSARMSSAILKGLGHPEWIAETPERYGEIVASLSADLAKLRKGKQALRQELFESPLMDGEHLSLALEKTFEAMTKMT